MEDINHNFFMQGDTVSIWGDNIGSVKFMVFFNFINTRSNTKDKRDFFYTISKKGVEMIFSAIKDTRFLETCTCRMVLSEKTINWNNPLVEYTGHYINGIPGGKFKQRKNIF
jgi:hypothetical protein